MLSFSTENIASRLQFTLCQQKYKELIALIKGKLSSPAALEVLAAIESLNIPLDKMGNDSRMKRIVENMRAILN